jgi:hypothetical protein
MHDIAEQNLFKSMAGGWAGVTGKMAAEVSAMLAWRCSHPRSTNIAPHSFKLDLPPDTAVLRYGDEESQEVAEKAAPGQGNDQAPSRDPVSRRRAQNFEWAGSVTKHVAGKSITEAWSATMS